MTSSKGFLVTGPNFPNGYPVAPTFIPNGSRNCSSAKARFAWLSGRSTPKQSTLVHVVPKPRPSRARGRPPTAGMALALCLSGFILGLPLITPAGFYWVGIFSSWPDRFVVFTACGMEVRNLD